MNKATHPLAPLLRPRSIAVLGASERPGTVGEQVLRNLRQGGFDGPLYAVNPTRDTVAGMRCHPDLASLPERVEQVIFAIADTRVEKALDDTIAHGARSAVIYSSLVLEDDTEPDLRARVHRRIRESGLLVCGANGMGYYNFHDGVWACGFDTRGNHPRGGNVTLISHSGAGMSGIVDCEERIDFNLAVSTGQELCVTMDRYIDFAIECLETRAIGLFMETARDPEGLATALEKAADRGIPVVALKAGRTDLAAQLTVSHTGALAGRDAAYQALFDRYGVHRVEDMDELATTLILFAQPHPVGDGGLVTLHDSGGERQLLIDLADRVGVPLAKITKDTEAELTELLDPGLPPVNPLDAWSTGGPQYHETMGACFAALMSDPGAALGAVVHDRAPYGAIYADYTGYLRAGHAATGKPAVLVANRQGSGSDPLVLETTRAGFPVLDGLRSFLVGARCLFAHRDFQKRWNQRAATLPTAFAIDDGVVERWSARLAAGEALDECDAGRLLADFGLPVNPARRAGSEDEARAAADELGYPAVLKSAQPGLQHKTERDGVRLGLRDEAALRAAYRDLAERLGPDVLVARMIDAPGVEMILGVVRDEQFGALVMLGFGGVHAEVMEDVAFALPPFDAATARRLLDDLALRPLLDARRGRPAADVDAFCEAAARLSALAARLGDLVAEIDLNPVIVTAGGCVAVDALAIGRRRGAEPREDVNDEDEHGENGDKHRHEIEERYSA